MSAAAHKGAALIKAMQSLDGIKCPGSAIGFGITLGCTTARLTTATNLFLKVITPPQDCNNSMLVSGTELNGKFAVIQSKGD